MRGEKGSVRPGWSGSTWGSRDNDVEPLVTWYMGRPWPVVSSVLSSLLSQKTHRTVPATFHC